MVETFRIVLRDTKRYDAFETREFDLPMNSTFPIGRASRNATKKELMPAQHNAYIDSPVVSREHAVLSANASSGKPDVYITDSGSMHGTMLNDERLAINVPAKLSWGDKLQFGTDVNRNEEYFVARTYVFEAQLRQPFSLGFTVPESDSEEESLVAHRGSQRDPLIIDESDAASDQSDVDEDDQADVTMAVADDFQHEEPVKPLSPPQDECSESALRATVVDENYNEDEGMHVFDLHRDDSLEPGSPSDSMEGENDAFEAGFDSEITSIRSSQMSYDSELEVHDSEDEEAQDAEISNSFEPSTAHEFRPSSTFAMPTEQPSIASRPTDQTDIYNLDAMGRPVRLSRLDSFDQLYDSNPMTTGNLFTDRLNADMKISDPDDKLSTQSAPSSEPHFTAPDSAPPFATWGNNSAFDSFGQGDHQTWYPDATRQASFFGTNPGDRPSLFNPAPRPPTQGSVEARAPVSSLLDDFSGPPFAAYPMPENETPAPLLPGRRTKVTIEEIVGERPLTPESVNSMKRKADVLDEVEPAVVHESAMASEETAVVSEEVAPNQSLANSTAIQTAAMIAQRPKKVPRSILSRALGKATYPLLGVTGAAVSFALLSTLPDSFFV